MGKICGTTPKDDRYCCLRSERERVFGKPDKDWISTSGIERQNLTMCMSTRRFTRKTNAFSKKVENHLAAISLHFMYYNFCCTQQSLRITPAMEVGVMGSVLDIGCILKIVNGE